MAIQACLSINWFGSIIHRQSREPADCNLGAASARRYPGHQRSVDTAPELDLLPVRPTDGNALNVSSPTSSRGGRRAAPQLRENRRNTSDENGSPWTVRQARRAKAKPSIGTNG